MLAGLTNKWNIELIKLLNSLIAAPESMVVYPTAQKESFIYLCYVRNDSEVFWGDIKLILENYKNLLCLLKV